MPEVNTVSYGRGQGWLGRWYDPGLELASDLSGELLAGEERERIGRSLAVVLYAATIPRRLGGDASDDELASDKKRCRRVGHALRQAYRGWDKANVEIPTGEDIKQEGAQLVWEEFQVAHLSVLTIRTARAATWAVRSGETKWGKSAVTNFENERNWVTYALRD